MTTSHNKNLLETHTCIQLVWLDRSERFDNLWRQDEFSNAGKELRLKKEAPAVFSNHNASRLSSKKCFRGTLINSKSDYKPHNYEQTRKCLNYNWKWLVENIRTCFNHPHIDIRKWLIENAWISSPLPLCHRACQAWYVHCVTNAYSS